MVSVDILHMTGLLIVVPQILYSVPFIDTEMCDIQEVEIEFPVCISVRYGTEPIGLSLHFTP